MALTDEERAERRQKAFTRIFELREQYRAIRAQADDHPGADIGGLVSEWTPEQVRLSSEYDALNDASDAIWEQLRDMAGGMMEVIDGLIEELALCRSPKRGYTMRELEEKFFPNAAPDDREELPPTSATTPPYGFQ